MLDRGSHSGACGFPTTGALDWLALLLAAGAMGYVVAHLAGGLRAW